MSEPRAHFPRERLGRDTQVAHGAAEHEGVHGSFGGELLQEPQLLLDFEHAAPDAVVGQPQTLDTQVFRDDVAGDEEDRHHRREGRGEAPRRGCVLPLL
jgi:hypothetical protein